MSGQRPKSHDVPVNITNSLTKLVTGLFQGIFASPDGGKQRWKALGRFTQCRQCNLQLIRDVTHDPP
ncbi:hypothetical protein GCM10009570_22560 [Dietzia natronolimnaea]